MSEKRLPVPLKKQERAHTLSQYNLLDFLPEERFNRLTKIASALCGTPISMITMMDKNRHWIKSIRGLDIYESSFEDPFCHYTIMQDGIFEVENIETDKRFSVYPPFSTNFTIRFFAGKALIDPDGFALGTLCVMDHKPRKLTDQQKEALNDLADEVMDTILARKEKEELIKTNKFLQQSNEAAKVGGWELDLRNDRLEWTSVTKKIHEINEDFVPDAEFAVRFYKDEENRDIIRESVSRVIETGGQFSHDLQIITAQGNHKWVRVNGNAEFDEEGCKRVYGTFQDINEQKRSELALFEEKDKLENVLIGTHSGTYEWDVQPDHMYVNNRLAEMLGYKAEEINPLTKYTWIKMAHPEDLGEVEQALTKCLNREKDHYDCVFRMKHKDGHWVWIRDRGKVRSWSGDGKPLKMYGTYVDVSLRKNAEISLIESRDHFQSLITNVPGASYRCELFPDGTILESPLKFMSKQVEDITGYPSSDFINGEVRNFSDVIHPDDLDHVIENVQKAITGIEKDWEMEYRVIHKNGEVRWCSERGRSYRDQLSGVIYLTGLIFDITDRKKTDQALIEKQTLLETILESIDVGIASCDSSGKQTLLNRAARIWYGRSSDNLELDSFLIDFSLYQADGKTPLENHEIPLVQALNEGKSVRKEIVVKSEGKPSRTINTHGTQLRGPDGELFGAVTTMQDISDRKSGEIRIRQSEEQFRKTFEYAANGMAVLDLDGKWLKVNKQLGAILGYSQKELQGMNFRDVTHPDEIEKDNRLLQELIDGKREYYNVEKRYIHKNGDVRWVLTAVSALEDEESEKTRFISQYTNITSQKEAEQQLHETLKKLEGILEASTQVVIVSTDPDGVITSFNAGAENLLGYTADEMIGKETPLLYHLESEIEERSRELAKKVNHPVEGFDLFRVNKCNETHETHEWTLIKKNGDTFPVQLTATAIRNSRGDTIGHLGIATDISELKRSEEEMKQLLEMNQDQNQRLLNFAHIVSHNLRGHATNFSMITEILSFEEDPEEIKQLQSMLKTASDNLSETVENLNEIVKINTSTNHALKPVHIRKRLEKAIENNRAFISETSARIEIGDSIDENLSVQGVPAYIDSILMNLINNAIKYRRPDQDPVVKINSRTADDGNVVISVEDNGLGIDLNKHGDYLFSLYKTFHGNRDARGVGLYITKNQVDAMEGKIEVKSTIGKGTKFDVYLAKSRE
ncbi:PAS domain S-box protein [Rhodohalobacter sp. SW132]|uniref:PAS domain S-box protein n=1 Tax=Rhodohalobacter sp. SW132 TaxID=2293433 RepID=UPI000E24F27E|nr:PAS domain S-box protein [Rhodohalobacter sp. SW132]REL39179.1 PAS domain S-box protein [Rhodohalobacter sp. SW132]